MGHMANSTYAFTVEQQQKLDTVKGKYSTELDALQSSLNKKSDAYSKALTDESTTVGTLNRLEAERVARLRAPAGLDIGAITPEEMVQAFVDLANWVENGVKPTP